MKFFKRFYRESQQPQQFKERARPEIPQRAQQRREDAEEERRAERGGHNGIEPQLAVPNAQCENEKRQRERQAVKRVERFGKALPGAAAQPQGAQQVVEQRERHAEQERRGKQPKLCVDGNAHISRQTAAKAARRAPFPRPHSSASPRARRRAARRRRD